MSSPVPEIGSIFPPPPKAAEGMPNPTPEMLSGDPLFDAIWEVIKTWDINVPDYYHGYCGGNGSHVTLLYQAVMGALPKMSNKLTIVKVLPQNGEFSPGPEDLERWRQKFAADARKATEEGITSGQIRVEVLPEKSREERHITLVKVGGEDYLPTLEDLENWRKLFEDATNDPDFKIFTHPSVEIEIIPVGKIVDVE